MRVFVTGGTGFVGSAIVHELTTAGHHVVALARSDAGTRVLAERGVEVLRGDLEDHDSLRRGVEAADGVIHAGFIHEFARYKEVCEIDRRAITTMGEVLVGSDRPLVVTSGAALVAPGRLATEADTPQGDASTMPRIATDEATAALVERGVRASLVRLSPSVHGDGDHGFVPMLMALAKDKGASAYIGEGANRWNAVHLLDAARLYRLALEQAPAGARLHAVAEPEVAFRDIAEAIGKGLGLPVVAVGPADAAAHFGWFTHFAGLDCPASSTATRERYGWHPTGPTLLEDLAHGTYLSEQRSVASVSYN